MSLWLATGVGRPDSRRSHYIRTHIKQEQSGACALCGTQEMWNGRPLVLVLDHLDGDSTNNTRDNLRLVCPNCDSQLPTYQNRNKGNGRHARRQRYANGQSY
ncbi:HNH endonuclease [Nocardioides sp.]|uniref:HNH endonuclease n=1 Tax=Nocardioides sp. TaxID=35761 RepID=UPI00286E3E69|nr:HNH endonuclease [Nocardioides sp.]